MKEDEIIGTDFWCVLIFDCYLSHQNDKTSIGVPICLNISRTLLKSLHCTLISFRPPWCLHVSICCLFSSIYVCIRFDILLLLVSFSLFSLHSFMRECAWKSIRCFHFKFRPIHTQTIPTSNNCNTKNSLEFSLWKQNESFPPV